MDLFASEPLAPLAERLRPQHLSEVIGQEHLTDSNKPLGLSVASGKAHSMILWGPPGVGKTTLARIFANSFNAQFLPLSAVLSGVKDIRQAIEQAQMAQQQGKSTILFVDEVHRFNKSQQDAFLPYVENGLLTFIGATTENPSFEVNPALLSRAQVYVLKSLQEAQLQQLLAKALSLPEYAHLHIDAEAKQALFHMADGDGRRFLNSVEHSLQAALTQQLTHIDAQVVSQSAGALLRRFDKGADVFYDQISALHKSVRGSHPDAALYWFCRMVDGGVDMAYLSRRIVRMAWEDIGLADPRAMQLANDAASTFERLGTPEGELALAQAVLYLATAAKSNAGYMAYKQARQFVRESGSAPVPLHLRNAPTALMKQLGHGEHYRYAHDEPNAYAAGATYMPDHLAEPEFYQPVNRGLEIKIAEKLAYLKQLDAQAQNTRQDD